jgi:hypothetical protein
VTPPSSSDPPAVIQRVTFAPVNPDDPPPLWRAFWAEFAWMFEGEKSELAHLFAVALTATNDLTGAAVFIEAISKFEKSRADIEKTKEETRGLRLQNDLLEQAGKHASSVASIVENTDVPDVALERLQKSIAIMWAKDAEFSLVPRIKGEGGLPGG